MGATKVSDEQKASRGTESAPKAHKQDLERQETIPLKASPGSGDQDGTSEPYSKRKAAIACVSTVVFFGLVILTFWLVLRPVYPASFAIDDIQILALTVNTTTSTITVDIAYNVTAFNRNGKVGFRYSRITVDASYSGRNFARSTIPKFKLATRRNAPMHTLHFVTNATMPPAEASSLALAIQNGSVPLRVFANAKLRMTIGKMRLSPENVNVDCRFTAMRASAPSTTRAFNVVSKVCRLTRPRYKKAKKFAAYKPSAIRRRPRLL